MLKLLKKSYSSILYLKINFISTRKKRKPVENYRKERQ